ncbi:hypothetical protein [Halovivax limisalsi]|uniref:hypothetical protein n=1 Tax=Halovivax limisalsi TaxID=1453760 RepID=UPI001FFD1675|nr:hypothetical protein [Halovivax limisalsi]
MSATAATRGSRAFVAAGVVWFVAFNAAVLAGASRSAAVVTGLYGFVFSVVFGKAYALVPSYFDRELALPSAPLAHLPFATVGVLGLFFGRLGPGDPLVGRSEAVGLSADGLLTVGALAWLAGVLVFVGTLAWTVRDNLTGSETGTSEANAERRRVDRAANAVVPLVGFYLVWGSLLPVAEALDVRPSPIDVVLGPLGAASLSPMPTGPAATHVLAAGAAVLMLFGVGFRLLPRFLVGTPRFSLVATALAAGAPAPFLLAFDFYGGPAFALGATLLAVAVVAYALVVLELIANSDRRRVGFTGVGAGALFGVVVVALGWGMGVHGLDPGLATAHYRLALGGFLGLTIVGVTYQFYPPAIGEAPGVGDRNALLVIVGLAVGFAIEAVGVGLEATAALDGIVALDPAALTATGSAIVFAASLGYAWILLSIFEQRR